MRKLSDLLKNVPDVNTIRFLDKQITGIAFDSRKVDPGNIFVAIDGLSQDGHKYIPDAVEAGATAVFGTRAVNLQVPYFQVLDSRRALAYLSAGFYDFPARKLTVIGITGTDGKTTTSNLLYQIMRTAGFDVGMISTVNAHIGDQILDTGFHVTTPDSPDLQKYLSMMVETGLTHVILETTSHSLEQRRVDACEFDIGVITNITHEHLDAHNNSIERYREAKGRLFSLLAETKVKPHGNPRLSIINRDDWSYNYLQAYIPGSQITYGLGTDADIQAVEPEISISGNSFSAVGQGFNVRVNSPMLGAYNISNSLAALATGIIGLGIDPNTAAMGISQLKAIRGRMERINLGQKFSVLVDFAHTPNALLNALKTARSLTKAKVITVFGSAGLRDREKRKMMAEVSVELADLSIFTAEDPRTESLMNILKDMSEGAESKGGIKEKSYWCIPDRGDAIRFALELSNEGDLVIVCGKGHEQSMCFGKTEYPWDDRTAVESALADYLGVSGPDMPYLPTRK